jgi:hypothetical protein
MREICSSFKVFSYRFRILPELSSFFIDFHFDLNPVEEQIHLLNIYLKTVLPLKRIAIGRINWIIIFSLVHAVLFPNSSFERLYVEIINKIKHSK